MSFYTFTHPRSCSSPLYVENLMDGVSSKVSIEIWYHQEKIFFCIRCDDNTKSLLEAHDFQITPTEDFFNSSEKWYTQELLLKRSSIFPIKRWKQSLHNPMQEYRDPYQNILSTLTEKNVTQGIQITFEPYLKWRAIAQDTFAIHQVFSNRYIPFYESFLKAVEKNTLLRNCIKWQLFPLDAHDENIRQHAQASETEKDAVLSKVNQKAFLVSIRFLSSSKAALTNTTKSFEQFDSHLNGFNTTRVRKVQRSGTKPKSFILSREELATILPYKTPGLPNIHQNLFQKLRSNDFHGITVGMDNGKFVQIESLEKHLAIFGKTGSGKSTCALNILLHLLKQGEGIGVFDPHGDLADELLKNIPKSRIKDVVFVDPTDKKFAVAFNPLKANLPAEKIVSSFVDSIKNVFPDSFGPRTDYLLSQAIYTLTYHKEPSLLMISRLFFDSHFRKKILKRIDNPMIHNFFNHEYQKLSPRFRYESLFPILNKVNRFLMFPSLRYILGQTDNFLDFRSIIDSRKILIVNLAKGEIGQSNSVLLGTLILSYLQQAIFSRSNTNQRTPFYLFVDEVQNFLHSAGPLQALLDEGRKYRVSLITACQHISQMGNFRETLFGNVNSMVAFSLGVTDAKILSEYFPKLEFDDILNLPPYHSYLRSFQNDQPVFTSMENFIQKPPKISYKDRIIRYSQRNYCRRKSDITREVFQIMNPSVTDIP